MSGLGALQMTSPMGLAIKLVSPSIRNSFVLNPKGPRRLHIKAVHYAIIYHLRCG